MNDGLAICWAGRGWYISEARGDTCHVISQSYKGESAAREALEKLRQQRAAERKP